MAEQERPPRKADWSWVRQSRSLSLGGCLTFVRGSSPEQMIAAFGMDPDAARMLTFATASEWFLPGGSPWIRVGQAGDWTFAIEELSCLSLVENVGRELSAGTGAAVVGWSAKPTSEFRYFIDRAVVTVFDSTMPWDRSGSEPDRFLSQMRDVGILVERPAARRRRGPRNLEEERRRPGRDPVIASLDMLTLALGIRLPEDQALGPLLTVRRDPP